MFVNDFGQLAWIGAFQLLSAAAQFLAGLDESLCHAFMGNLRSPNHRKLFGTGNAAMPVIIIESHSEQMGPGGFLVPFTHAKAVYLLKGIFKPHYCFFDSMRQGWLLFKEMPPDRWDNKS